MVYIPTHTQRSSAEVVRRKPVEIPQTTSQSACQSQFLIVGCGDELQGDGSVGASVVTTIDSWQLASINSVFVHQLSLALILDLAKADYAIFVEPCAESDRARTIQIQPVVASQLASDPIFVEPERCNPEVLVSLTRQIYGDCPQAWLFKIPTENFRFGRRLSPTAKAGVDRAVQTVNQFLRTY